MRKRQNVVFLIFRCCRGLPQRAVKCKSGCHLSEKWNFTINSQERKNSNVCDAVVVVVKTNHIFSQKKMLTKKFSWGMVWGSNLVFFNIITISWPRSDHILDGYRLKWLFLILKRSYKKPEKRVSKKLHGTEKATSNMQRKRRFIAPFLCYLKNPLNFYLATLTSFFSVIKTYSLKGMFGIVVIRLQVHFKL